MRPPLAVTRWTRIPLRQVEVHSGRNGTLGCGPRRPGEHDLVSTRKDTMKLFNVRRPIRRLRHLAALAALLITISGCAIDSGQLITDITEAGLNSITTSLVNALSVSLAKP